MQDIKQVLADAVNVSDAPAPYPVENARHNYAMDNGNPQGLKLTAVMTDKPVRSTSLKEKLEAFKVRAAGAGKLEIGKANSLSDSHQIAGE